MSYQLTPVTTAYRTAVAAAAAGGAPISPIAYMAFGTVAAPYHPDTDTDVPGEFKRVPVSLSVDGPTVTARAVLTGQDAGAKGVEGAGVFTLDGTLVGRRVLARKELEAEAELEIEITFEY